MNEDKLPDFADDPAPQKPPLICLVRRKTPAEWVRRIQIDWAQDILRYNSWMARHPEYDGVDFGDDWHRLPGEVDSLDDRYPELKVILRNIHKGTTPQDN